MRILHFIYDHINNPWVGGGGAVRVYEIYRRLSQKGHFITVVSGKYPGAQNYKVNENFEYRFLGNPKNYVFSTFSYAFEAIRFLRENTKDYDVIVEDFAPWNPVFSYLLENQRPVVLQLQNYMGKEILRKYNLLGIPFYLMEKLYPRKFRNLIVISEALNQRWNIEGKVIPQGIEKLEEDAKLGSYVAFLGRIDIHQKGIDLLVKAFKDLKGSELLIAGDGKDRERFLKLVRGFEHVRYIGKVTGERKYEFIKKARFFVMPSRFEGQGIVALEVASMGKPLIVSDIPELKYVVDNGFGISFKKEDPQDLREKIQMLLRDDQLVLKMGKRGIEFAKNFTWDRIAQEYEKYLIQVEKC
ncbi:glycosyltransferase family 4 protein [Hydrogenobacter thermophilus]|uniref:glycosyltransferase family 4 protein n=1 Tax=Hydrogenobacter thermophilus TaxID=940 RepID=UPI0030F4E877